MKTDSFHQYFERSSIHALLSLLVKRYDNQTRNREFNSLAAYFKQGLDIGNIDTFMHVLSQQISYYDPDTLKQYRLDSHPTIYEILLHIQKEATRIDLFCAYREFDGLANIVREQLAQTVHEYPEKIDIENTFLFEDIDLYILDSVMADHQFIVKYCDAAKLESITKTVEESNVPSKLLIKACLDEMLKLIEHIDKQ